MISFSVSAEGHVAVTFSDNDPARRGQWVGVAGDFNGWDPVATPMRWSDGRYTATVVLSAQLHRFRYWSSLNGWFNDDSVTSFEFNEFGQQNCVLDLAGSRPAQAQPPDEPTGGPPALELQWAPAG